MVGLGETHRMKLHTVGAYVQGGPKSKPQRFVHIFAKY